MKWFNNASQHRVLLAGVILVALVVRLAAALYMGNEIKNLPGLTDQISYHTLANRVIDGHGFTFGENWWPATRAGEPTAHWSYLYTFYLIDVYTLFGSNPLVARTIQVVLTTILQTVLVYLIGSTLFNRAVGVIAAALLAGYAYLIYYAPALLTESFYITAVLATLYLSIQMTRDDLAPIGRVGLAVSLGLCIGIAVLLRQLFLLTLPFIFLWILWSASRPKAAANEPLPNQPGPAAPIRKRVGWTLAQLAISAVVLALMILPFTVYNYARFHSLVLLNTNAGYAFYWANHPIYGTQFEWIISREKSNYLEMLPKELMSQKLNEAELERELLKRGIQFVLDDPWRYALLSLSRIPSYFTFWPTPRSSLLSNLSRVLSFGITWPFMLYGMIAALRKLSRKEFLSSPVFLLFLFFAIYSLIHILTWTMPRYRVPVDAVLLIFAAYALRDLYLRIRARLGRPAAAPAVR